MMTLDRRTLLTSVVGLTAWSRGWSLAEDALPALVGYERDTGGRIGLYAKNLSTGTTITWRGNERFVMCSTFKTSLAALVLTRIDRGQDKLEYMIPYGSSDIPDWHAPVAKQNLAKGGMSVAAMCEAAVEYSDNTCTNLLLARVGGPNSLTAFWRATGDSVTRLDHNEPALNLSRPGDPRDTTTPVAMAGTLRRLLLGRVLSPESRKHLVGWMVNCKTGDNRLRGGLPKHWIIGDKTGNNGIDAAGDIAVVWPKPNAPVLVCAYTQGGSPAAAQLEAVFAEIGRIVGELLG
jgi:beta-lactamase class A